MNTRPLPADDYYVGYLPVPAHHLRTLRVVIPVVLLTLVGVVALLAFSQRGPGRGDWRTKVESFTGAILTEPWPLVVTQGETPRVVLLVEEGKHGAQARVDGLAGRAGTARGYVLTRDGRVILELLGGSEGVVIAGDAPPVPTSPGTPISVTGEIIDSKCYHGAMKPGEGKTHKACATLCISSGIPAMFIANDGSAYLLDVEGTAGLDKDTLSKVGEPVRLTGVATTLADMRVLRIAPGSVQRVP